MREEPPLEGLDVGPFGVGRVNEEAFVVVEDVGDHETDEREEQVFRARQGKARERAGLFQTISPFFRLPGEAGTDCVCVAGSIAFRGELCKWVIEWGNSGRGGRVVAYIGHGGTASRAAGNILGDIR